MSKRKYKISVIQLNLNDVAENNLKKCISWVRDAASQGAEVILLPELYSSHYFCQSEDVDNFALAEPLYSTSFIAFSELAKELGVVIIVPFFEKRMAGIYHNSAYIIDTDGTEAGLYRKMHIPDDPHFYEKFYFTPGDLGFQAIETKKGTVGTLICWDQWYP
jgi:N-carbamoylputrescine amidase